MAKRVRKQTSLDIPAKCSHVVHLLRDHFRFTRLEAEWYTYRNLNYVIVEPDYRVIADNLAKTWRDTGYLDFIETMKEHYR